MADAESVFLVCNDAGNVPLPVEGDPAEIRLVADFVVEVVEVTDRIRSAEP